MGGHIRCMHARPHCTVAKTTSPYGTTSPYAAPARSFPLFDLALQDENISGSKGPRGTRRNGDMSEARFLLQINCKSERFVLPAICRSIQVVSAGIANFDISKPGVDHFTSIPLFRTPAYRLKFDRSFRPD